MTFPYKQVLVIGATSGIGAALVDKFVVNNVSVVAVGRRQENLDALVKKHGSEMVHTAVFDILELQQIPKFITEITTSYPDIDCVLLNSGIQRGFDFCKPEAIDLKILEQELTTNYLSHVHLTTAILPFLQKQSGKTSLIYTTSQLGLVPMVRCANYGASKAALHHFILAIREQLKNGPGDVKIVEIYPPAVQTELHDDKHQPDLKNGDQIGMPLAEFIDATWLELSAGQDQIAIGSAKDVFDSFEVARQNAFHKMTEIMDGLLKNFLK